MTKTDWELEEITEEEDGISQVVICFHWDRSVNDLPNLNACGQLFYPYTGNRHPHSGYYVRYVPADSRSIATLGRMGGVGNGQTIEVTTADFWDRPGEGNPAQWR